MPIVGLTSTASHEYVSRADSSWRPNGEHLDDATRWTIGTLDGFQQSRVRDAQAKYAIAGLDEAGKPKGMDVEMQVFSGSYEALRFGLHGWKNFVDATGKTIEYKTTQIQVGRQSYHVVPDELLKRIPPDLAVELGREIMERNSISDALAGKSEGPSSPQG